MLAQTFGFHHVPSAGTSLVTSHLSMAHQMLNPLLRIAYLELSCFPTMAFMLHRSQAYNFMDLWPFLNTPEWDVVLLDRIKYSSGVDFFFSPLSTQWENLLLADFKCFFQLLLSKYDLIYIDIHISLPTPILKYIETQLNLGVYVSYTDPISLHVAHQFFDNASSHIPWYLILNQAHKYDAKLIKNAPVPLLRTLSTDTRAVSTFFFQKKELLNLKRSKLTKDLWEMAKDLNEIPLFSFPSIK